MIPDHDGCREQILRFSGLMGWPKRPEGVQELISVATNSFQTLVALRRAVDELLRSAKRCPVPSDLYEMAASLYERQKPSNYACTICYDTGTVVGPVLFTYEREGTVRKQRLTEEQAEEIWKRSRDAENKAGKLERGGNAEEANQERRANCLEVGKQMIYEYPFPCVCKRQIA